MMQPETAAGSTGFYQRKADELRRLTKSEVNADLRDQHLRIAAMYQALADHSAKRSAAKTVSSRSGISIPKGVPSSA